MIEYNKVIDGIIQYIDHELTPKLSGINKIMFGTASGIAAKKGTNIFETLKDNKLLKSLDIIEGNHINVDLIYEEMSRQASNEPVSLDIPLIGTLKLNKDDLQRLYSYITR